MGATQKIGMGVLAIVVVLIFGDIIVWDKLWKLFDWAVLLIFVPAALFLIICARSLIIHEAQEVTFEFLGKFAASLIQYTGYCYNENGVIVAEENLGADDDGSDTWGSSWLIWRWEGFVFYPWPFIRPVPYRERNDDDGFGEGYFVHLHEMQEEFILLQAETTERSKDGKEGAVAIDVSWLVKWRICNPRRYRYVAPRDAKQQIINGQKAIIWSWVNSGDERRARSVKGNGSRLWAELVDPNVVNAQPLFDSVKFQWGLEIIPNGIVIMGVGYDPEYQKALKARNQEELLAQGEAARIYDPIKIATGETDLKLGKEEAIALRSQALAGANFSMSKNETSIDVKSGGKEVNPGFTGIVAAAEVIGNAIARAFGKGGGAGGGGTNQGGGGSGSNQGNNPNPQNGESNEDYLKRRKRELGIN